MRKMNKKACVLFRSLCLLFFLLFQSDIVQAKHWVEMPGAGEMSVDTDSREQHGKLATILFKMPFYNMAELVMTFDCEKRLYMVGTPNEGAVKGLVALEKAITIACTSKRQWWEPW